MVKDVFLHILVANVMRSRMSHIQISQDRFFPLLNGLYPNYLVLKFSNILPINN